MKRLSGRILFDLFLLVAAAWGLVRALSLPPAFGPGQIGPGDFPAAVMIAAILTLLAILWQDVVAERARTRSDDDLAAGARRRGALGVLTLAGLLAGYVALLEPLGFLVATTFFLFAGVITCTCFLNWPDTGRAWRALVISAAVLAVTGSVLTFVVFTCGFGLIFP